MNIKFKFLSAAVVLGAATGVAAQTADWPTKPVTVTTPFPVGSGPDAVMRLLADKLATTWKQRVVIDNKPGAGGFIAIDATRRMPADGYSLVLLDSEHVAAAPHLYKKRNFKPFETFDMVGPVFRASFALAVSAESKVRNVAELVAQAKAKNGKMTYGSWGVGSPGHLGGAYLESLTGAGMQHVAYRETSQLFMSVASGDVDWSFGSIPSSAGVYKAGKIKYLAVAASKRLPQLPDVPTMAEAGGPTNFELNSIAVIAAPKGMPAALVEKINKDLAKAIADPEVRARLDTYAFEPLFWSNTELRGQLAERSKTYETLIERANVSLD